MSDLPPGISQDMIPGNRPEDLVWDRFYDWLNDYADAHGLEPDEIQARIDICGKTRQGGGSFLRCHRRTDHPGPCHFRPTDADTSAVDADEAWATEMFLCEANAVFLRSDRLYRFVEDPDCEGCREQADVYREPTP